MTSLNKTASWVVVYKDSNKPVIEVFSQKTANTIQTKHSDIYKVVPILQYLQEFNRSLHDLRH
jgi:hypothetical protein